jgi:hypothetical protein
MLTSVLEQTGKSQDFWAGKFDLDRSHLNKLLRGKRAVGPKAAGRLISCLPQQYHQDLLAAHIFDELLAVTSNMGAAGKTPSKAKGSAKASALPHPEKPESTLVKFLEPFQPSLKRVMELQDPGINKALEKFLSGVLEQGKL